MAHASRMYADIRVDGPGGGDPNAAPDAVSDQQRMRRLEGELAAGRKTSLLAGELRLAHGRRDVRRRRRHADARSTLRPQAREHEGSVPGDVGSHSIAHPDEVEAVGHPKQVIVSYIRHSIAAIRLVITAIAFLAASPATAVGQDLGPTSFRDSLVMRQIAYRAPCPAVVPRAWTLVDSTLGRGLRCSLVEAAAR